MHVERMKVESELKENGEKVAMFGKSLVYLLAKLFALSSLDCNYTKVSKLSLTNTFI